MKEKFGNEYLNQKLETPKDVLENAKVADYEEFGEHSYDLDNGSFEYTIGGTTLSLEYSKPNFEELIQEKHVASSLFKFNNIDPAKANDSEEFLATVDGIIDNVRVLDKLVLKNKDGEYDVKENFNQGKIFFNYASNSDAASCFQLETKNIFLAKDPLTPEGLVSLIHEKGHYKDIYTGEEFTQEYNKMQTKMATIFQEAAIYTTENTKLEGKTFEEAAEAMIKRERAAWSFALKDLKPFIKDLNIKIDDLGDFIHGKCLQSYSTFIRKVLR